MRYKEHQFWPIAMTHGGRIYPLNKVVKEVTKKNGQCLCLIKDRNLQLG